MKNPSLKAQVYALGKVIDQDFSSEFSLLYGASFRFRDIKYEDIIANEEFINSATLSRVLTLNEETFTEEEKTAIKLLIEHLPPVDLK